VVHEAVRTGGFGAEIAAQAAEKGFWDLNGPVLRIAAPDTPKPSAPTLEAVAMPDAGGIAGHIRRGLSDAREHA
jgi:2-oxoisovalerate dehydrogenase E1 component